VPRHQASGRFLTTFALLLVLGAAVAAAAWYRLQAFANTRLALPPQGDHVLVVEPGDGFATVLHKLRALGLTQGHDLEWRLLAEWLHMAGKIQVGDYALADGMSPRELLLGLGGGNVIQHRIAIIPGWNFRTLRDALAAQTDLQPLTAGMKDEEIMARLGRPGVHPEGRFLPETYLYTRGSTDLQVLERAADAMDKALADAWSQREPNAKIDTPDRMLTLASIVEKETGVASERPQIAGVFLRRLELGMLLQTDPTVIYGIGPSYDGNIRKSDLLTDTPYNTYVRAGLPPTPIAMPGKEALDAVAHPAPGKALYFVATGEGAHVFSATLAEHNAAVAKYQLRHR
jgi:UPF0755 protein